MPTDSDIVDKYFKPGSTSIHQFVQIDWINSSTYPVVLAATGVPTTTGEPAYYYFEHAPNQAGSMSYTGSNYEIYAPQPALQPGQGGLPGPSSTFSYLNIRFDSCPCLGTSRFVVTGPAWPIQGPDALTHPGSYLKFESPYG